MHLETHRTAKITHRVLLATSPYNFYKEAVYQTVSALMFVNRPTNS